MKGRARVAANLRRLRLAREISQEHLAVDAGVDRTYVGGVERGEINASVDLLERLGAALGADIAAFFVLPDADAVEPTPLRRGPKARHERPVTPGQGDPG